MYTFAILLNFFYLQMTTFRSPLENSLCMAQHNHHIILSSIFYLEMSLELVMYHPVQDRYKNHRKMFLLFIYIYIYIYIYITLHEILLMLSYHNKILTLET